MIEKPTEGTAPSSFAAVGRYILDPMIFDILEKIPTGKGGEVQLTDAITIAGRAVPVVAFQFSGTRHDCGNHDGLLAASVARKEKARQESAIAGLVTAYSATSAASSHALLCV
jgi:UTP--glucose-1-phosphate uridylyltransferase